MEIKISYFENESEKKHDFKSYDNLQELYDQIEEINTGLSDFVNHPEKSLKIEKEKIVKKKEEPQKKEEEKTKEVIEAID